MKNWRCVQTWGCFIRSPTVPYTIDMLEGGISGIFYVLDQQKAGYRAVEPYMVLGLAYDQDRYYGSYLDKTRRNRSVSEETLLGRIESIRSCAGVGAEFQLFNNEQQFIQLFIEATVGASFLQNASNSAFSRTTIDQPVTILMGVVFGNVP